jgi:HD-like signal output (HDOD) protein/phage FluMu protein Com
MKIKCPNCKAMSRPAADLTLTFQAGLDLKCPKCKSLIQLYLLCSPQIDRSPKLPTGGNATFKQKAHAIPADDSEKNSEILALKSKILRSLIDLPPMPHIILKAKEIIADPSSSLKDLASVIETDQAIVARVLTLANSAYYGISGMVSSIQHASILLGQKTLAELITISASSRLLNRRLKGYKIEPADMWKHSLAVAFGSRIIADRVDPDLLDDAFVAGLLHDAGKIILDPHIAERRMKFVAFLKDGQKSILDAEIETLGFDHAEIMSRATRFWRFPETQSTAIRFHHLPSLSEGHQLAHIIYLADCIAKSAGFITTGGKSVTEPAPAALAFLGIQEADLVGVTDEFVESVRKLEEEFEEQAISQ